VAGANGTPPKKERYRCGGGSGWQLPAAARLLVGAPFGGESSRCCGAGCYAGEGGVVA
jgi:hypothetical protein